MSTTKATARKQHKKVKRKDRLNRKLDLGSPQVPLRKQKQEQKHELLSDWEDAS